MAGMAPAYPSAISNPVATCWGRYLWQYDILGLLLERQRWGHTEVSRTVFHLAAAGNGGRNCRAAFFLRWKENTSCCAFCLPHISESGTKATPCAKEEKCLPPWMSWGTLPTQHTEQQQNLQPRKEWLTAGGDGNRCRQYICNRTCLCSKHSKSPEGDWLAVANTESIEVIQHDTTAPKLTAQQGAWILVLPILILTRNCVSCFILDVVHLLVQFHLTKHSIYPAQCLEAACSSRLHPAWGTNITKHLNGVQI